MNPDDKGLFTDLEPPPGGVERFRRQLEQRDIPPTRTPGRILAAGLAAAGFALAIVAVWWTDKTGIEPEPQSLAQAEEFDRLLGRSLRWTDLSVAINEEPVSVDEIPSASAGIRIYEIKRD